MINLNFRQGISSQLKQQQIELSGANQFSSWSPMTNTIQSVISDMIDQKLGQYVGDQKSQFDAQNLTQQLTYAATPQASQQQQQWAASPNSLAFASKLLSEQIEKDNAIADASTTATMEAQTNDMLKQSQEQTQAVQDAIQRGLTHTPTNDAAVQKYAQKKAAKAVQKAQKKASESGQQLSEAQIQNISQNAADSAMNTVKNSNIAGQVLSGVSNLVSPFLAEKTEYAGDEGNLAQTLDNAYDQVSDAASAIPVWGTLVSGIMKGGAMAGKVLNNLGVGTDGMTKTDAILSSSFLNLTPVGLINAAGAKSANKVNFGWQDNMKHAELQGGYGGSERLLADAKHKSGKKYGLFSSSDRRAANALIAQADSVNNTLNTIADENEIRQLAANGMTDINTQQYMNDLTGQRVDNIAIGKEGLKLPNFDAYLEDFNGYSGEADTEISEWTPEEPIKFKAGGSLNLIPEGALHARLNKMEGGGKDFTKKGIPVIDKNGTQQAEIECNEIIFRKEATERLEQLWKDGSDEAAIEAGKLLVDEIFNKTEDRTGLIKALTGEEEKHLESTPETSTKDTPLENNPAKKEQGGTIEVSALTNVERDVLLKLLMEKAQNYD